MTKQPYTDEELREMVKCIPVYPYILEDSDVWDGGGHCFLCSSSKQFRKWWGALHENTEIMEYYVWMCGLITEEEYEMDNEGRIDGYKLRQFYLEYCRDFMLEAQ